jgi:hypothetical protein
MRTGLIRAWQLPERWQPWLLRRQAVDRPVDDVLGRHRGFEPLFVPRPCWSPAGVLGLVIAVPQPRAFASSAGHTAHVEIAHRRDAVSGLLFITGGLWDEIWHRLYGVSEVLNDFLWPPHKMLYGSMGINAAIVLVALFAGLRGRGSLLQRLRAEPLIALIGVASAYMMFSAPSDAIWHQIYGLDITAWSLPHILLVGGVALIMITATVIQVSLLPPPIWQSLRGRAGAGGRIRPGELVVVLLLLAAMVICMQVAVTG